MSTLHVSIDIDGDRELSRTIHGLTRAVRDWSPAFRVIAADWSATMERKFATDGAFESGTDADGNPLPGWAPLSARYAAQKARRYPGRGILERTGTLRRAAVAPEQEVSATQLRLTIATPYAIYHQSSRPRRGNLPRRPFASLTARQKSRWVRALRDHLKAATEGA